MTRDRQRGLARTIAAVGGAIVMAGTVLLVIDYVRARAAEPRDAVAVAALQERAQSDAGAALELAQEQDRITRTRQARKRRDDAAAIVMLIAGALFVAGAKWSIATRGPRPVALPLSAIPLELVTDVSPRGLTHGTVGVGQPFRADEGVGQAFRPDISVVDELVRTHGRSREAAIPILQAIQAHYRYLPDEALRRVCELTEITPAQIAGTSSFYARFRRSPVGDHVIRVCHGTACHVSGARQITEELRRHLGIPDGADTDAARRFTIDEVACLGCCSLAPVMMVDEHTAGRLTPATASAALDVVRETEPA